MAIKTYRASRTSYIAKEYQILLALGGQISIPHAYGITGDQLVMSLVKGQQLNHYSFTDAKKMATFLSRLIEAVAHIHYRGIIHNNLHQAHIIVASNTTEDPLPMITGFGNACLKEDGYHIPKSRIADFGEKTLLPKKVLKGERKLSTISDVYCLGVIVSRLTFVTQRNSSTGVSFVERIHEWMESFSRFCLSGSPSLEPTHVTLLEKAALLEELLTALC